MRPLAQRLDTQTDDELIQVLVPRPGTHGDDGDYVPDFILVATVSEQKTRDKICYNVLLTTFQKK